MTIRMIFVFSVLCLSLSISAAPPRALPEGEQPADKRLEPLKDLNGYFPLEVPATLEQWESRKADVKQQLQVATGLWPMPMRGPVQAEEHGTIQREGYTVTRVFFESYPGLFVTGSLYKPDTGESLYPAILSPHGHWDSGRFHQHSDDGLKQELASNAEKFDQGGRYPLQARCVQLARMGCIVFEYDMLGYADSAPLSFELAHRFAEQRPDFSSPDNWGLFSAQSELRLINALGLQTWNSLRAFDWLASRSDVDTSRIGVTGASGGGTQTFLLAAIEPRVTAAFPAVMVSTAMQGGCTCENASYLRRRTGNIELAGLIAPRPLGMTGANDWTVEIETKGFPELRQLYGLYGSPDLVEAKYFDFPHNYNIVSRAMMYDFFARHFKLNDLQPEQDFVPLTQEEMTVWTDAHPRPASDDNAERALMQSVANLNADQLQQLTPRDQATLENYREVVGSAFDTLIDRRLADVGPVTYEVTSENDANGIHQSVGMLTVEKHGESIPVVVFSSAESSRGTVVWPHVQGKAGLFGEEGVIEEVQSVVQAGYRVIGADLIGQGEFTDDGNPWSESRSVENPREFLGYTVGYNDPLPAQRVHDILSLIQFALQTDGEKEVVVAGGDAAAGWAALAAAQSDGVVSRLALVPGDFAFEKITEIRDPNLLPGAVKYGSLSGMTALHAPKPLLIVGTQPGSLTKGGYDVFEKSPLSVSSKPDDPFCQIATWIVGE